MSYYLNSGQQIFHNAVELFFRSSGADVLPQGGKVTTLQLPPDVEYEKLVARSGAQSFRAF